MTHEEMEKRIAKALDATRGAAKEACEPLASARYLLADRSRKLGRAFDALTDAELDGKQAAVIAEAIFGVGAAGDLHGRLKAVSDAGMNKVNKNEAEVGAWFTAVQCVSALRDASGTMLRVSMDAEQALYAVEALIARGAS